MQRIRFHPTTLLLAWLAFALAVGMSGQHALAAASVIVAALVWYGGVSRCAPLLRRSRVLLITIVLSHGWLISGTPLLPGSEYLPSREGLGAGLLQAWRLLLLLGSLSALLGTISQERLLAGIHGLLAPAKWLGIPVARFTVRLTLTLRYAEAMPRATSLTAHWENALAPTAGRPAVLTFDAPSFGREDMLLALGVLGLLGLVLW